MNADDDRPDTEEQDVADARMDQPVGEMPNSLVDTEQNQPGDQRPPTEVDPGGD